MMNVKIDFPWGSPGWHFLLLTLQKPFGDYYFPVFGEAQAHASPFSMVCDMSVVQMGKGGDQTLFLVNESQKKPKKKQKSAEPRVLTFWILS